MGDAFLIKFPPRQPLAESDGILTRDVHDGMIRVLGKIRDWRWLAFCIVEEKLVIPDSRFPGGGHEILRDGLEFHFHPVLPRFPEDHPFAFL